MRFACFTCKQKKTSVAMPHQLCREYMGGMCDALWFSNTAAKPTDGRKISGRRKLEEVVRTNTCPTGTFRHLTYDADDKGKQVDDAVKDLDAPLWLISENSVDKDGWRDNSQHSSSRHWINVENALLTNSYFLRFLLV